jgi:hypothetical protein
MNNEQQHIIDEVYENYWNSKHDADKTFQYEGHNIETRRMNKDEFIDMVKTDEEYGRRWGLQIEERELTYKERWFLKYNETFEEWYDRNWKNGDIIIPRCSLDDEWTKQGIPTKLITVTYNNETIKSYE